MTTPPPTPRRAALMLVLVTLLWGVSFPLTKTWQDAAADCPGGEALASLTLIAVRMALGLLVLGALRPRLFREPGRREHLAGAAVGVAFFLGFALQTWGMAQTTPAMSAFITSLGSAWVPLLALVFLRLPVAGVTLLGLLVGIAGTAVLGIDFDSGWQLGGGEAKTLLASVLFAVQILLLDRLGKRVRSAHLTAGFLGVTGLCAGALMLLLAALGPGLGAWASWLGGMLSKGEVALSLALLVLLPTVLAFHWMNAYQPHVSAGRAALIYLLEPVFAAAFSVLLGKDAVTFRLISGGFLILAGNLLIEVPYWLGQRGRDSGAAPSA